MRSCPSINWSDVARRCFATLLEDELSVTLDSSLTNVPSGKDQSTRRLGKAMDRVAVELATHEADCKADLIKGIQDLGGEVKPRDLYGVKRFNKTSSVATAALDELVGCGLGQWEHRASPGGKGGRPSRVFVLNSPTSSCNSSPSKRGESQSARATTKYDTLIDTAQLAEAWGIGTRTVSNLRQDGLPVVMIGRSVRFCMADCEAWLIEHQAKGDGRG